MAVRSTLETVCGLQSSSVISPWQYIKRIRCDGRICRFQSSCESVGHARPGRSTPINLLHDRCRVSPTTQRSHHCVHIRYRTPGRRTHPDRCLAASEQQLGTLSANGDPERVPQRELATAGNARIGGRYCTVAVGLPHQSMEEITSVVPVSFLEQDLRTGRAEYASQSR